MKKNIFSIPFFIIIIFVLMIILTSEVFALEVDWPASPLGTDLTDTSTLPELVKYLYEWGIFLGGLAFFIALLIAGMQYLTSVGNPEITKEAKKRITSAFLGLILLLGSWLILNTINPQLTTFHNPTFGGSASSTEDIDIATKVAKPCEYAHYYSEPNYSNLIETLKPGERRIGNITGSIRAFMKLKVNETCELNKIDGLNIPGNKFDEAWKCEKKFGVKICTCQNDTDCYCEGGACSSKIYAKSTWNVLTIIGLEQRRCQEQISEFWAVEPDIITRADREIKCIILDMDKRVK